MTVRRACDVCQFYREPGTVRRYGLQRQVRGEGESHATTYGAGGIDLCDPCWEKIARPKMRPQRSNRKEV